MTTTGFLSHTNRPSEDIARGVRKAAHRTELDREQCDATSVSPAILAKAGLMEPSSTRAARYLRYAREWNLVLITESLLETLG